MLTSDPVRTAKCQCGFWLMYMKYKVPYNCTLGGEVNDDKPHTVQAVSRPLRVGSSKIPRHTEVQTFEVAYNYKLVRPHAAEICAIHISRLSRCRYELNCQIVLCCVSARYKQT